MATVLQKTCVRMWQNTVVLQTQDKMEWMRKQISPQLSCITMFIYLEFTHLYPFSTSAALAKAPRWNLHFHLCTLPSHSLHSCQSDYKNNMELCYPCLSKICQKAHCTLNKIQIPLRSHFLSCLCQSLRSSLTDLLSVPVKYSCLKAIGLWPAVLFCPYVTKLSVSHQDSFKLFPFFLGILSKSTCVLFIYHNLVLFSS